MNDVDDTGDVTPERPLAKRRPRIVMILAAVVVVAIFVVALQFAPEGTEAETPAAAPAAQQNDSAVVPPPGGTPPSSSQAPAPQVPEPEGPKFDGWVDEVAGWLDIPQRTMHGYALATVTMGKEQPGCALSWVTLAAIGKVTTDHGRAEGSSIGPDGMATKPINTVVLKDFEGKTISVPKAAGPLQIPPAMWGKFAASPGGAEPRQQHIDDAALTAARALCDGGRNLAAGEDWLNAVIDFQKAPLFQHRVLATANLYGTVGQNAQPPNPAVLRAVNFAIDKIGLPYVWGGNGVEKGHAGFDCSGLTTAAYGISGIALQRRADWQFRSIARVNEPEPRLGDLIFFGEPNTFIHHVGIYIGNQQMIDAPTFGQAVQVHPYRKQGDDYAGAGRPV